jgi:hypothetical protein
MPMTPDELAEVMVVIPEKRRVTVPEVCDWLQKPGPAEPALESPLPIPITPEMSPVLRELARRQFRQELAFRAQTTWQRRHNVGTRTVMLQGFQGVPWKEEMWRWMDERYAAREATLQQIHDDCVVALRSLDMRAIDLKAHGAVILHLGWLGRLWHRWRGRGTV